MSAVAQKAWKKKITLPTGEIVFLQSPKVSHQIFIFIFMYCITPLLYILISVVGIKPLLLSKVLYSKITTKIVPITGTGCYEVLLSGPQLNLQASHVLCGQ